MAALSPTMDKRPMQDNAATYVVRMGLVGFYSMQLLRNKQQDILLSQKKKYLFTQKRLLSF
jgi:hypothetical protein